MSDSSPRIYFPATPRERELLSHEPEEEEEEEEPEELEQEEEGRDGIGLSVKLANSTFSVEIHMLGVEPNAEALTSAKNFLREVLELAQEFRMLH